MAIAFLKFINQMINRSGGDSNKIAQFIANLEGAGIFPLLQKQGHHGNDDINNQIKVFQISTNSIAESERYQLEVHKNRVKQLELHSRVLEWKVEQYKEQHATFMVVMNDMEVYKNKADMSKELGTFYSPFLPINTFSRDELIR